LAWAPAPPFPAALLHRVDLEVSLGHQLLQPRILLLELLQAPNICDLEVPISLAPGVDRGFAHAVLLCDLRHRGLIGLTQNPDHLIFGIPPLLHGFSLPGAPCSQLSNGPKIPRQVNSWPPEQCWAATEFLK